MVFVGVVDGVEKLGVVLVVIVDGVEKLACVMLWSQHKSLALFEVCQGSFCVNKVTFEITQFVCALLLVQVSPNHNYFVNWHERVAFQQSSFGR